MTLVNDFNLHRTLHLQALGDLHHGVPDGLPGQLLELAPTVTEFDEARAKIEADAHLTAAGKAHALDTAREKATLAVEAWRTVRIAGLDAQMVAQEAALRAQADKDVAPPTEFAIRYMAEKLAALDPLEVEVLYSDASEQERRTIEAASESVGRVPRRRGREGALVWEHLLNPARIASVRHARLERANPEVIATRRDLQRISNTYTAMAGAAVGLFK